MTEPADPVEPPRDDWRILNDALFEILCDIGEQERLTVDEYQRIREVEARRDALLAVEEHRDEHPPTPNRGRQRLHELLAQIADAAHAVGNEPIYDDALDALDILAGWVSPHLQLDEPRDEHPPTFHLRPVWVNGYRVECSTLEEAQSLPVPSIPADLLELDEKLKFVKQWRWGAREVNGEIVIPESEPLTKRAHALDRIRKTIAGFPGASIIDETGEEVA